MNKDERLLFLRPANSFIQGIKEFEFCLGANRCQNDMLMRILDWQVTLCLEMSSSIIYEWYF